MAEDHPAKWTLFCVAVNENSPFQIEIRPDATVGDMKDAIKREKRPEFDGFAAHRLTLYRVNLPDDDDLAKNVEQQTTLKPPLMPLKVTRLVSALFPASPPKKTICILVQTPTISK